MTERHSQRYRASLGIDDGDDSYRFLKDQKASAIDGVDGYPQPKTFTERALNLCLPAQCHEAVAPILSDADALQAEIERLRAYRDRLLEWHREVKPVVDAAVAWLRAPLSNCQEAEDALVAAIEAYEEGKDELLNRSGKITQRVAQIDEDNWTERERHLWADAYQEGYQGAISDRPVAKPPQSATDAGDSVLLDTSPASYLTGSPPEGMVQYWAPVHGNQPLQSADQKGCGLREGSEPTGNTRLGDHSGPPAPSGDEIAWHCGDTFIDFYDMPPTDQWERIVELLADEGMAVVKTGPQSGDPYPAPSRDLQSADQKGCKQPNDKLYQSADTTSGDDAQTIHAVDDIHSPAPSGDAYVNSRIAEGIRAEVDRLHVEGREQGIREAAEWLNHQFDRRRPRSGRDMLRDLLEGDDD